jgi:hypothetical protein
MSSFAMCERERIHEGGEMPGIVILVDTSVWIDHSRSFGRTTRLSPVAADLGIGFTRN